MQEENKDKKSSYSEPTTQDVHHPLVDRVNMLEYMCPLSKGGLAVVAALSVLASHRRRYYATSRWRHRSMSLGTWATAESDNPWPRSSAPCRYAM